jgi:cysteine synthase
MRKRLSEDALEYFREQGAKGGKLGGASGGTTAAANMTAAQRTARALKASRAAALVRTAKRKAAIDALGAQLTDLDRKRKAAALARTKKTHAKKGK